MLFVFLLLGIILLVVFSTAAKNSGSSSSKKAGVPEVRYIQKPVMTPSEVKMFELLRQAFPDFSVCPQMSMAAIVDVGPTSPNSLKNRSKFSQKIVDFVVLDKSFSVFAIVELDDKSHDGASNKAKDSQRDVFLTSLGYKTYRFDVRGNLSVEAILKKICNEPRKVA